MLTHANMDSVNLYGFFPEGLSIMIDKLIQQYNFVYPNSSAEILSVHANLVHRKWMEMFIRT